MASTLEKIEGNAHNIGKLADRSATLSQDLVEVSRRVMSLDQSQLALSKTLYAMTEALIAKGIISSQEVMTELRKLEDRNSQERVNYLVQGGLLEAVAKVEADSTVVISQTDAEGELFAGYYTIEMDSPMTGQSLKESLLGCEVGSKFDIEIKKEGSDLSSLSCEVLEIYASVSISNGEADEQK